MIGGESPRIGFQTSFPFFLVFEVAEPYSTPATKCWVRQPDLQVPIMAIEAEYLLKMIVKLFS